MVSWTHKVDLSKPLIGGMHHEVFRLSNADLTREILYVVRGRCCAFLQPTKQMLAIHKLVWPVFSLYVDAVAWNAAEPCNESRSLVLDLFRKMTDTLDGKEPTATPYLGNTK